MNAIIKLFAIAVIFTISSCNAQTKNPENMNNDKNINEKVTKTEEEWRKELSPEQYRILREKGTEAPYSGKYNKHKAKGTYVCAACKNVLFKSDTKFDSGCGWPAFYAAAAKDNIITKKDVSFGMERIEIMCAKCGGHLGHIFDDGPEPTGLRYCVNSVSIEFIEEK